MAADVGSAFPTRPKATAKLAEAPNVREGGRRTSGPAEAGHYGSEAGLAFELAAPTRSATPTLHAHAAKIIASQTAIGFAWTAAALAVGFATKMLLTRKMPAEELGIVLAAQAFVALVVVVAELGVPDAVVRYVGMEASAHSAARPTVRAALKTVSIAAFATSVLVLVALFVWPVTTMSSGARWTTAILAIGLPLVALGDVLGAAFRGASRLGTKLVLIDVARPGIVAAALLVAPLAVTAHAPYVAMLYVAGSMIVLGVLWLLFGRDPRWQNTRGCAPLELLRFGIPVAGAAVLAGPLVNSLLPMMLSAWTGSASVAFYGIALALQGFAGLPLGILEQVLVPQWARLAATGTAEDLVHSYQHYAAIGFACAAGLGIPLLANDRFVLSFLFGPDYVSAGPALQWAVVATLVAAWTGPNEAMLRAIGLPRALLAARVITAVAGTAAGALLIPAHGLTGAVAAFAIAVVVLNVAYGAALYRARRIHPFTLRHVVAMLTALAAVLAAMLLHGDYSMTGWTIAHLLAVSIVVCSADLRSAFAAIRSLEGVSR